MPKRGSGVSSPQSRNGLHSSSAQLESKGGLSVNGVADVAAKFECEHGLGDACYLPASARLLGLRQVTVTGMGSSVSGAKGRSARSSMDGKQSGDSAKLAKAIVQPAVLFVPACA